MVWGNSYSKFKSVNVNPGTVVSLGYSLLQPTWTEPQVLENVSILTGTSDFIKLSNDLGQFDVVSNIWKNGLSAATVMNNLLAYNHDVVNFMPHQDSGVYIKADGGGDAEFFIILMQPFYLQNSPPLLQDRLLVRFVSKGALNIAGSM